MCSTVQWLVCENDSICAKSNNDRWIDGVAVRFRNVSKTTFSSRCVFIFFCSNFLPDRCRARICPDSD